VFFLDVRNYFLKRRLEINMSEPKKRVGDFSRLFASGLEGDFSFCHNLKSHSKLSLN